MGDAPDAQATADRIATVTATVNFTVSSDDGPRERQHQATLAVLLANAVVASADSAPADDPSEAGNSTSGSGAGTTYTEAIVDLVGNRIDSRTRVVARAAEGSRKVTVGPKPPRDAEVAVAAFSVPAGAESEYVRIVVQRWSHA